MQGSKSQLAAIYLPHFACGQSQQWKDQNTNTKIKTTMQGSKSQLQLFTFLTLPLVSLNNGKIKTPTQRSKQQCKDPKVNLQLFTFLTLPHFACGQSPPRPPSPSRALPLQQTFCRPHQCKDQNITKCMTDQDIEYLIECCNLSTR